MSGVFAVIELYFYYCIYSDDISRIILGANAMPL
jgi:hypothetical protein